MSAISKDGASLFEDGLGRGGEGVPGSGSTVSTSSYIPFCVLHYLALDGQPLISKYGHSFMLVKQIAANQNQQLSWHVLSSLAEFS